MKTLFVSIGLATAAAGAQASIEPPLAVAAVQTASAKLEVKGATTATATQPLLFIVDGKTFRDPAVDELAKFLNDRPVFKLVQITPGKKVARLVAKSTAAGPAFLEFDVAAEMLPYAKLKVGAELSAQIQKAGASTLIRFMAGTVPIGFMTSDGVAVK